VIEDIEGATSEPSRRRHVVVLSGCVAITSLVLLFSWVAPPELGMDRQAPSPDPSASAGPAMTIVTGPTMFFPAGPSYFQSGTTSPSSVNVKLVSECADGTQINPPYYLVFEGNGQVMTVPVDVSKPPSPQFISVDRGSGWLTVSCATSTIRVPRMDRRR
jgi:hypothetical protein